jgi:hypothetical protein
MPEICYFQGIKIYVYFDDEDPPHIHAHYMNEWVKLAIEDGRVLAGALPRHTLTIIRHWMRKRRVKLMTAWDLAKANKDPGHIDPPGRPSGRRKRS